MLDARNEIFLRVRRCESIAECHEYKLRNSASFYFTTHKAGKIFHLISDINFSPLDHALPRSSRKQREETEQLQFLGTAGPIRMREECVLPQLGSAKFSLKRPRTVFIVRRGRRKKGCPRLFAEHERGIEGSAGTY